MIPAFKTCTQEFIENKEPVHPGITSLAVFARGYLWTPGDTITVSFNEPTTSLEWEFTVEQLSSLLQKSDIEVEKRVRGMNNYSDIVKEVVQTYVAPVVPTLNIKFVDSGGDVRVSFNSAGGSSSLVGTNSKASTSESTITFAWLDVGTIIHEFSHALGMLHELQSPAVDIPWNKNAVYAYYADTNRWSREQVDSNVLNPSSRDQVLNSKFDPASVMIYPIPAELTTNGFYTDINLRYSETDIQWLGKQYNVPESVIAANVKKFVNQPRGGGFKGGSTGSSSSKTGAGVTIALVFGAILFIIILFFILKK